MVVASRGAEYLARRRRYMRDWVPCPECHDAKWWCRRCNGVGLVPPPPSSPVRSAVGTADGERPCVACPVGILPKAPAVEREGVLYHPGCWARVRR